MTIKKYLKNIVTQMAILIKNRFILFAFLMGIFIVISHHFSGNILPSTEFNDLWFYSGIFMLLFSILFIEPYYTSPKNVITNTIPLLLVFLSIKNSIDNQVYWWWLFSLILLLLTISIIAIALDDKNKSPNHKNNKISAYLRKSVVIIGHGKVLYSGVFLMFLFINKLSLEENKISDTYLIFLVVLWGLILLIDPQKISSTFTRIKSQRDDNAIGEIFGVQSKKIFLAKLFDDRKSIKKFDVVKFRYSMMDTNDMIITGIVFDTYLLNQEKWAKILQLDDPKKEELTLEKNIVYKLTTTTEIKKAEEDLRINDLAGIVIEGSNIGKIKFEYSKKNDDIQEGDLLELKVGDKRLFYQVINGTTQKEKLEARNETGFIDGEAIQLGEWHNESFSFQKFGWVPSINTPVFKTDASDIVMSDITYPNYEIGIIPSSNLAAIIDLSDAISHHTALLGVTGSGKSFLAREIINQIKCDTKVICVDFNKEFITTLIPAPSSIISADREADISEKIDWINNELEKFGNQQDKLRIESKQDEINSLLKTDIESFLDNPSSNISVFELPDVSNTTSILDYTKCFFKTLFEIAKERQLDDNPIKACVVLEEAHTIIPEWNFSGSNDKISRSLVNSIGQITLQGRKYGVGFLVIAQRTANVSKTVLTQCNTVICFQAFDETSFNFLGNYVGKDMVQTLPNLKQFHAIVAGKAIKSNVPLIVDLRR